MNNGSRPDNIKLKAEVGKCRVFSWGYILQPLNLSLIGLAVAVTLWGFAYKLSLYQPDETHASRSSVAKLWFGPKTGLATTRKRDLSRPYPIAPLELIPPCQARTTLTLNNDARTIHDRVCSVVDGHSVCMPRPPPLDFGPSNNGAVA
jgi:hypothetical protein